MISGSAPLWLVQGWQGEVSTLCFTISPHAGVDPPLLANSPALVFLSFNTAASHNVWWWLHDLEYSGSSSLLPSGATERCTFQTWGMLQPAVWISGKKENQGGLLTYWSVIYTEHEIGFKMTTTHKGKLLCIPVPTHWSIQKEPYTSLQKECSWHRSPSQRLKVHLKSYSIGLQSWHIIPYHTCHPPTLQLLLSISLKASWAALSSLPAFWNFISQAFLTLNLAE